MSIVSLQHIESQQKHYTSDAVYVVTNHTKYELDWINIQWSIQLIFFCFLFFFVFCGSLMLLWSWNIGINWSRATSSTIMRILTFIIFTMSEKTAALNFSFTAALVLLNTLFFLFFNASQKTGGGDSSVVRATDSWSKGRGFESLQERRENFLLQGQLSVLTLYFGIRSTPVLPAVARKRPRLFCQKCRWQVTAKHAYTLCLWLCMKWYGAWLYGVHRTHRDGSSFMWHQPCQRCKYTALVDIQKRVIKSYSLM